MQFEIEVPYTENFIKRAAWLTTLQVTKGFAVFFGILTLIALLLCWVQPSYWWSAPYCLLLFSVVFLVTYFRVLKNGHKTLKKLGDKPAIRFAFSDISISCISALGHSEIIWKALDKLQKFPDIWLFYPNALTYFIIPTKLLTAEQQECILNKLKENQVPIR